MQLLESSHTTGFIKYLNPGEFKRIEAYFATLRSPSMRMCLRLLMYLGIRESEVVELNINQFSQDFRQVRVHLKKKKLATDKPRALPFFLSEELRHYYRRYRRRMTNGFLFFAGYANQSKNEHLRTSSIRFKFLQMRKALKLEEVYHTCKNGKELHRISPHTFRHYFVWKVYKACGNDIITTRDIVGHVKVETTAKYARSLDAIYNEQAIIEKAWENH